MPMKWNACCVAGLNWLALHERTRTSGGLLAAVESRGYRLLSYWFHGEQQLGCPAHDARFGFRRATPDVSGAAHTLNAHERIGLRRNNDTEFLFRDAGRR